MIWILLTLVILLFLWVIIFTAAFGTLEERLNRAIQIIDQNAEVANAFYSSIPQEQSVKAILKLKENSKAFSHASSRS